MSKRILVVEDQEDLRAILRDFLSASGYTVIEAVDGAESVAKAVSQRPDLVLMDIQLPVLDGYDATRQIKRAILRDFLSASGYTVIEAVDGAESVAKAVSQRPDLVLMDIQLPVLDGYDATRQIKALPGLAAIPIIAVSSFAMKGDEEKARASGCDDYVTKPYSPVELLRLVRRYLGETAQR